ncbi:MAG: helix-turn-helix domain-containing protein [Eubacteriales bacterium]
MDLSDEEIARKRRKNVWTQDQLELYSGISDKAVSKWERGLSQPSDSHQTKLVELFSLPTDEEDPEDKPVNLFWSAALSLILRVKQELGRIVSTAVIFSPAYCYLAGYLTTEETVVSIGLSTGFFCFCTLIRGE